jgi:hypothetical protein
MAFVIICEYTASINDGRGGFSTPKSRVCGILESDVEANAKALVKSLSKRLTSGTSAGDWGNHSPKFSYTNVPVRSSSDSLALLEEIASDMEKVFAPE